jgi:O-antigen/teichoic acid export membrane protein
MKLNSRKRITINASSAVLQVVVVGVVYFLLYRYLLHRLGAPMLGLWSLIVATTSVANLANLGFTSGLVKFVAEKNAVNDTSSLGKLIFTALLSISALYVVLSGLILVFAPYLLTLLVEPEYVETAVALLPWSLGSLLLTAIGGVFTSVLEGFQKNYLRNLVYIFTSVFFLLISIVLIPRFGIIGVAIAQIIQATIVLGYTYYHTRANLHSFHLLHWDWDRASFRTMFGYGYKFQFISIIQLIVDPLAKALLSKFGGLPALAWYEMAYRLASQVRAAIINAYQVTIPVIAHYNQTQKENLKPFYLRSFPFVLTAGAIATVVLVFISGLLSRIWVGHYESVFINSSIIVALGMLANILCSPAYFNYLGVGNLNLLVWAQIINSIVYLILSLVLSRFFPVYGVVLAWSVSATLGAFIIMIAFHRTHLLRFKELFRRKDRNMLISSGLMVGISAWLYNLPGFASWFSRQNVWYELGVMSLMLFLFIFVNLFTTERWFYYRTRISQWLSQLAAK